MTVTQVKDFRATTPDVKPTSEDVRAANRYLLLVEELIREYADRSDKETQRSRERGAISHIAAELGVKQSSLSKILSHDRRAGPAVVRAAIKRLRIREEYFYAPKEPVTYRDYIARGKEPIFPAWKTFLERDSGRSMKPHEREIVAATPITDGMEPTWQFYEAQLFAQRTLLTRAEVGMVVEKAREIDTQAKLHKKPPHPASDEE
jgi:hypothetical protein